MDKSDLVISKSSPIFDALKKIDKNSIGIVFVSADGGHIIGCASDGDIRSFCYWEVLSTKKLNWL